MGIGLSICKPIINAATEAKSTPAITCGAPSLHLPYQIGGILNHEYRSQHHYYRRREEHLQLHRDRPVPRATRLPAPIPEQTASSSSSPLSGCGTPGSGGCRLWTAWNSYRRSGPPAPAHHRVSARTLEPAAKIGCPGPAGAGDYLTKPFGTAELLARITPLRHSQGAAGTQSLKYESRGSSQ